MRYPLWRTGRKLKKTLYERVATDGPSDDDHFIGIMETPELARRVVDAVNIVARMGSHVVQARPEEVAMCIECGAPAPCAYTILHTSKRQQEGQ